MCVDYQAELEDLDQSSPVDESRLLHVLGRVPKDQQSYLYQSMIQGLTVEEMARRRGESLLSTKNHYHDALTNARSIAYTILV